MKMHFGKESIQCPILKVHQSSMRSSDKQKYLGNMYNINCKIDEDIQIRCNKGIGIVNNILIILKHISFGYFNFEIALVLRNSLLISGILFNIEACIKLQKRHIKSIEDCDRNFQCPCVHANRELLYCYCYYALTLCYFEPKVHVFVVSTQQK